MYPNTFKVTDVARKKKRIHHFHPLPDSKSTNTPGRVTLTDLPSEVIIDIARHIAAGVDRTKIHSSHIHDFPRYNSRSLLHLALCSRRLHHLVEPVLYERFHHAGATTSAKGIQLFLLRLLARPELGRCVRVLRVDGTRAPILGLILSDNKADDAYTFRERYVGSYKTNFKDVIRFTAADLQVAGRKIAEACSTALEASEWLVALEASEWLAALEGRDLNAMIALILALTPNLQVLDIDMWTRPNDVPAVLTDMLSLAGQLQRDGQRGNPLALWELKKVVVRYQLAPDFEVATHHLLSVLTIPSVSILRAVHEELGSSYVDDFPMTDVDEVGLEDVLQGNDASLVNMRELSLSFMLVDPDALFRLWRCYPGLEKLYYEDRLDDDEDGDVYGRFDIDRYRGNNLIAEASRIIPRLQDLTILNQDYTWASLMGSSTMGVLTPFENLRRLEITWLILAYSGDLDDELFTHPTSQTIANAIPQSIEELRISARALDLQDSRYLVMDELLKQKHRFPALKTLDLGWQRGLRQRDDATMEETVHHRGFTDEEYARILARCQESGVELILEPAEPRMPRYIQYREDEDGNRTASGETEVLHVMHYPSDDSGNYERVCMENGCELATGRPGDWVERPGEERRIGGRAM